MAKRERWWRQVALVYGPPLMLLVGMTLVVRDGITTSVDGRVFEMQLDDFVRDPSAVALLPPYIGAISNLGVLLWCAAAAICFFAALTLGRLDPDDFRFLTRFGALSAILCLDDLYRLHESLGPNLLRLPEEVVLAVYAAVTMWLLVSHGWYIRKSPEAPIFLFALLLLGSSVVLDVMVPDTATTTWIEDSLKFLGIVGWSTYLIAVATRRMREVVRG